MYINISLKHHKILFLQTAAVVYWYRSLSRQSAHISCYEPSVLARSAVVLTIMCRTVTLLGLSLLCGLVLVSELNGQQWSKSQRPVELWWHAQKPDFVFRRNGRVHLNRRGGGAVQSTTDSRGAPISGSNAGDNMFRGCVKGTGYPLHSPVSSSLPLPCVTVCHHISTGFYLRILLAASVRCLLAVQSCDA